MKKLENEMSESEEAINIKKLLAAVKSDKLANAFKEEGKSIEIYPQDLIAIIKRAF